MQLKPSLSLVDLLLFNCSISNIAIFITTKFTFHKDKELILSNARFLAGSDFGILQDFPREINQSEIVEIRKELVKVSKQAKKDGHDVKLVYDKRYINGNRYQNPVHKDRHTVIMDNPLSRSLTSLQDKVKKEWK